MKKNIKNKGFTLIETLVAISILMIAIAGPLTIANKAYTAAAEAKNQSVATNLAQEAMELINYYKDNRMGIFSVWNTDSSSVPAIFGTCKVTGNSNCTFDTVPTTPTKFTRYYYFTNSSGGEITTATNQVIANVEVSWNTGSLANTIKLQSVLTNYQR